MEYNTLDELLEEEYNTLDELLDSKEFKKQMNNLNHVTTNAATKSQ